MPSEHSPPHRWLRNIYPLMDNVRIYSPPHRWLRKLLTAVSQPVRNSPPHRWLRNHNVHADA
ncbi:hypothetical protein [uncultured Gammaproteobacteria bacterium]|nr:hypothetical protein [uncultured Gammaproteobacteria bacterium]CAC9640119.1 hypothetical protein [uncultured Gammaproteobacteria bacterium]CAC9984851.1 hypothetical protein [uncultured Gammaproteobacteria bacterium]